jgi:peptide-methionine (R)-S-oxide reductase
VSDASDGIGKAGKVEKSEEEWMAQLGPEAYAVCRGKGTERPFTGRYWNTKTPGVYVCAGCGAPLFTSETKFDSHCGWPSFTAPVAAERIGTEQDLGFGMVRTEVHCSRCEAHLGHVFPDGPGPTGDRYCINSVSLKLHPGTGKTGGDKG